MGNVDRILKRDIIRLFRSPAAMIVAMALLVLPSIYTWYNVVAFWNPYESTGGLQVCVVNEDAGAESDVTGPLNVGDRIAEQLLENEKLSWSEEAYDAAMSDLKAGKLYAVYVIPRDFTECLLSPLSGQVKRPQLQYYVNEKLSPVSPKITDNAASTLDQTLNSQFVQTVTDVAVTTVDEAIQKAKDDIAESRASTASRVDDARLAIAQVREAIAGIQSATGEAKQKIATANDALTGANTLVDDAQVALADVASQTTAVQTGLSEASSQALPALTDVLVKASQVTRLASETADELVASSTAARADVDKAIAQVQPVVDALQGLADDLKKVSDDLPADSKLKESLDEAAADAEARGNWLQGVIDEATLMNEGITNALEVADESAETLDGAVRKLSGSFQGYTDSLLGTAAPAVNASLTQLSSSCSQMSSAIAGLHAVIQQAQAGLGQLDGVLSGCEAAVSKTGGLMGGVQQDVDAVVADARMLAQSDTIADLLKSGALNSQNISEFMGAPTQLNTVEFYPMNAYGAALAPLFMNLTFWIGAFMLMIIFRLEVDSEGVKNLTLSQRYLSRFLLFCSFAALPGIICCLGTLTLGVQAVNVPALLVAAALTSLAYLSIIYTLSSTFRHIGQGLCIVLVFTQIPGGSGLYPLELTSSFFQAIYPFLPFSYGIDAMREAIGGFYGGNYVHDLVVLGLFFFGALAFGLVMSSLMANVVRMASKQIREGDLYNGEDAVTPERPYRLSQVLRAITDREEYRKELERRYARFSRRYPLFIRGSIVLGVGVPVVLALLLALSTAEKVVLLTIFLLWLVGLLVFLVVMESQRYSFERQLGMGAMSDERAVSILSKRNHLSSVSADAEGVEHEERPEHAEAEGVEAPADAQRPEAPAECANASGQEQLIDAQHPEAPANAQHPEAPAECAGHDGRRADDE